MKEFTDTKFWKSYWDKHKIEKNVFVFFESLVTDFPRNSKLLEIGGFPGNFVAYFNKKLNCEVTILDSYIDPSKIRKVEEFNGIEQNTIKYIEADFLNTSLNEDYEIVCSFGFIEHFNNTKDIIDRHLKCLKKGGTLFITMPNFKSINGLVHRIFHKENYNRHNIKCMDIPLLVGIIKELKMDNFKIEYYGRPVIWLEKDAKIGNANRYLILNVINKIIGHLPFQKSKYLAPQIYIHGIK